MTKKEALIIGMGISGCVAARLLADAGYQVSCFERESHVGGALFDEVRPNGISVQSHGPHIFHTDKDHVYQFLKRFGSFYPYRHRVLVEIKGKTVPLPLNANSLEILFGSSQKDELLSRLMRQFPEQKRILIDQLIASSDSLLIDLGRYMIENVLINGINKRDDSDFAAADDSYMNDAYVDISTDDCYYTDSIQAMPRDGFTELMNTMISHPGITIYTDMDAFSRITLLPHSSTVLLDGMPFSGRVIITTSLDRLFDCCYGALEYRTSKITFQDMDSDTTRDGAVTVSPKGKNCIRTTESKLITLQEAPGKTTLCMESPYFSIANSLDEPFEPERSEENLKRHAQYMELCHNYPSISLLGRTAHYRNLSIAQCVEEAIECITSLK